MSDNLVQKFKAQRSNAFTIVLNDDFDGLILKDVRNVFHRIMVASLPIVFVACILHDRDTDEYNHVKINHYHIVLTLSSSIRIGTIINSLLDIFNGLRENMISIDKCTSVSAQTRYLIHLDDYDKFQYDESDIVTNNSSQVRYYLKEITKINDVNDLIAVVEQYKNLRELIRVLGIENYKKYRFVIKDLREY